MKRFIAFVLMLVLIFSFSVSAFAIGDNDTELDALNSIDYYIYWIFQDFSEDLEDLKTWNLNSMNQLLDINDFSRSIFNELSSLNNNLFGEISFLTPFADSILNEFSSLNDEFKFFSDSFFNGISWGEPFAEVVQDRLNSIDSSAESLSLLVSEIPGSLSNIREALYTIHGLGVAGWEDYEDSWFLAVYNDVHQLKEVLADDEDLAFKESQKENQQYIQDTFFNPGSDLSLDVSKLTDFTKQFTDFTDSFNFIEEVGTSTSPLESISEGSDFSQWFTTETGQDMDPTFGGGSGGGGETPDPDPDPDPEPTIKNWLPLATSEPGGTEIYNGIGYLPGYRWSNSSQNIVSSSDTSITGYIPCSLNDTIYFYNFNFIDTTIPSFIAFFDSSFVGSVTSSLLQPDSSGVLSFKPSDYVDSCNYFRFVFYTEGSENGIISINQYPIQTVSAYSLRAQSVPYINEPEVVTSYYADRMAEYYSMLGGDK